MTSQTLDTTRSKAGGETNAGATSKKPISKAHRAPRPSLNDPQPMVTIVLPREEFTGEADVKFCIHKNFICHNSPFFAAAFNGPFVEGETQSMKVDGVTVEEFGCIANWLYTKQLEDSNGVMVDDLNDLANLWMLAQRFLIPKLQNQIMRMLHNMMTKRSMHLMTFQFDNIVRGARYDELLKKLCLDKLAMVEPRSTFLAFSRGLPREMLWQLLQLMKEKLINKTTGMQPVEEYLVPVQAGDI